MSGQKRLVVNADGFGFGAGATQGIIDAIKQGNFISSVSVNANFPEVERVRDLVGSFPDISIGVHLNPMVGQPCLEASAVPSLVGTDGCFHNERFPVLMRQGKISRAELEAELDAQIERVKALVGASLTHIDSQGNRHLEYFDLFLKLAHKWQIRKMRNNASLICLESPTPRLSRLRVYLRKPHVYLAHVYRRYQMKRAREAGMSMADRLVTVGYAGSKATPTAWEWVLKNLPCGTYEIYCHPAYLDSTLRRWSYYCDERAQELSIMSSGQLARVAYDAGIEIISFHQL